MKTILVPLLALAVSATANAQSSGLQEGELILCSPAVQGGSSTAGAIMRIDPTDGTTSMLLDLATSPPGMDGIAYDPYRERLIFWGGFPTTGDAPRIHLLDGFGATTPLGYVDAPVHGFAPAAGGRIYFLAESNDEIHYLDASNQAHVLMDASGLQPFVAPGIGSTVLHYDASLNALFLATAGLASWTCNGASPNLTLTRIGLTADGSRVRGALACTDVQVHPNNGAVPVGLSHHPSGSLLLVAASNPGTYPRMNLVHPRTLEVTPFAWSGHPFAATERSGCWSSRLDRVVNHDTAADALRAYEVGQVGEGTLITTSVPIGTPGLSFESSTLIEVRPGACASLVSSYCLAKVTADGCVPEISGVGSPSASAPSGFTIRADNVRPGSAALLFLGYSGIATIPYQGGTLCLQPPLLRSVVLQSSGTSACSGVLEFDFNTFLAGSSTPFIDAGSLVYAQFIFRDPGHPIGGLGLTDALRFTVCP